MKLFDLMRGVALFAVAVALATPRPASAAQSFGDEGWAPSRVARITLATGDAAVRRGGTSEWARGETNAPLFEGDEVYVDRGARMEVALGEGRYARFGDGADVIFSRLADREARLEVVSGTLTLSIDRSDPGERFELSAPAAAVVPRGGGVFRIDVADNGDTWVTLLAGTAEIATPAGSFEAIDGDLVSLSYEDPYDIDLVADGARYSMDAWDRWSDDRDRAYADVARREREHPVELRALFGRTDVFGLAELAAHGIWRQLDGDRWGWQPREAQRADWAPYQEGYWDYSPVTGWTWISTEPWGWAPYHYGRWDFDDRYGWTWTLRDRTEYAAQAARSQRYSWRPALVYMWQPPGSNYYAWVPLAPGESYRAFGLPSMTAARQPSQRETASTMPRYLREQRGLVAITTTGLERRERPQPAARTPIARMLTAPASQPAPVAVVTLPRPARIVAPTRVAAVRVRPAETVKRRAVVVASTDVAAKTSPAQAREQHAVRKVERKQLRLERKAARQAEGTTVVAERPAPGKARRGKAKGKVDQRTGAPGTTAPEAKTTQPMTTQPATTEPAAGEQVEQNVEKKGKGKGKGKKAGKGKKTKGEPAPEEMPENPTPDQP